LIIFAGPFFPTVTVAAFKVAVSPHCHLAFSSIIGYGNCAEQNGCDCFSSRLTDSASVPLDDMTIHNTFPATKVCDFFKAAFSLRFVSIKCIDSFQGCLDIRLHDLGCRASGFPAISVGM
jgi:hypothetical protein